MNELVLHHRVHVNSLTGWGTPCASDRMVIQISVGYSRRSLSTCHRFDREAAFIQGRALDGLS